LAPQYYEVYVKNGGADISCRGRANHVKPTPQLHKICYKKPTLCTIRSHINKICL